MKEANNKLSALELLQLCIHFVQSDNRLSFITEMNSDFRQNSFDSHHFAVFLLEGTIGGIVVDDMRTGPRPQGKVAKDAQGPAAVRENRKKDMSDRVRAAA